MKISHTILFLPKKSVQQTNIFVNTNKNKANLLNQQHNFIHDGILFCVCKPSSKTAWATHCTLYGDLLNKILAGTLRPSMWTTACHRNASDKKFHSSSSSCIHSALNMSLLSECLLAVGINARKHAELSTMKQFMSFRHHDSKISMGSVVNVEAFPSHRGDLAFTSLHTTVRPSKLSYYVEPQKAGRMWWNVLCTMNPRVSFKFLFT